jgi:hypothetical protein
MEIEAARGGLWTRGWSLGGRVFFCSSFPPSPTPPFFFARIMECNCCEETTAGYSQEGKGGGGCMYIPMPTKRSKNVPPQDGTWGLGGSVIAAAGC